MKCGYVTGNIKKKADNRMDHTDEYIKEISEKIDSKKAIMLKSAIRSGNLQSPDSRNTDLLNCCSMY